MGKVVAFIDNVIVGTEIEEGHDEIVAEIIKGWRKTICI